jgi:predicted ATPase
LPRTVLSSATANENPTMLVAKKEMESWQLLQLEPSALRSPDEIVFSQTPKIQTDGKHLPATIFRLATTDRTVKYQLANRLKSLIDDVFEIEIDRDEKKDLLTLMVKGKNSGFIPARSLSDGTLRFLALSVIEADPLVTGVICLEEPENGIHPKRIKSIIELLEDMAVDMMKPNEPGNPLRQVIVNTYSPLVVSEIGQADLLFARLEFGMMGSSVTFVPLSKTWRAELNPVKTITKAEIITYLNPYRINREDHSNNGDLARHIGRSPRVLARPELAQLSLFVDVP